MLIAFSLAVTTWLDVSAARTRFNEHVQSRGQIIADSAADFVSDDVYFRDIDNLREAAQVVAAQPGVAFVEIADAQGRVFARTSNQLPDESVPGARQFERVIAPGGQEIGLLTVGLDDDELREELSSLTRNRIWQGLILFGAGTALAAVLGVVFTTPLRRLAVAASMLERGQLSTRVTPIGTSEMRALGMAFNSMADRIEKNESSLKSHQDKLEKRVLERTEEIRSIAQIGRLLSSELNIHNIFADFAQQFNDLVRNDGLILYECGAETKDLTHVARAGQVTPWPDQLQLTDDWDRDPEGQFQVFKISGQVEHSRLLNDATIELGSARSVAIPLLSNQQPIGILFVTRGDVDFDADAIDKCRRIGLQIAGALASSLLYERNMELAAERQRALEEDRNRLEAADVAKNEFLSSLSHELRTPLVAIIGYASMLIRHLSGSVNDVEMERLRTIERNGKRLSAQIEDLLDLSRIQTRRLEISQKWNEWRLFLKDVGQSMEPLLSATGHHLNLDIEHGDTWVFVDSTRIHQVVSNLIGNAAKYSPGASRVDVVSRVKSGEIVFSVRDYGAGIKPEDQKNLFTLFYRTEDAIKSAVPGTGIGLYVSKKIVELHKGDLNIDSIYGEGTTATLRLTSTATEPPVSALSAPAFRNRFEEQSA